MSSRRKKIILSAVIGVFVFSLIAVTTTPVLAQLPNSAGEQLKTLGGKVYNNDGKADPIEVYIGKVIAGLLSLMGVLFFILIFVGGVMWMTAGGEEEKVKKAQQIIKRAIVGLAIVLAAYAITFFVMNMFFTAAQNTSI